MEILTGILVLVALAVLFHLVIEHTWVVIGACVVAYVIYAYHAGPLVAGVTGAIVTSYPFQLLCFGVLVVIAFNAFFPSRKGN